MASVIQSTQRVIEWISKNAFGGVSPLAPAAELGREYLLDESYSSDAARAEHLVRQEIEKHYTTGFLKGFAATLAPPPGVDALLAAQWIVQARLAGAVATIFRHDLRDARVRTAAIACLLGEQLPDMLKQVPDLPTCRVDQMLARLDDRSVAEISAAVESGLVGEHASINASQCYRVGQTAIRIFQDESPAQVQASPAHRCDYWEPPS